MTIKSLTERCTSYWGENGEQISKGGMEALAAKVSEVEKQFDSLEPGQIEVLFSNLDDIPYGKLSSELLGKVNHLKTRAMRAMGLIESTQLDFEGCVDREDALGRADEMEARGMSPDEILALIEKEAAKGGNDMIGLFYFELKDRLSPALHSLEEMSSKELTAEEDGFPFDAPDDVYQDELTMIDNAVFEDGDLEAAFNELMDDLDFKLDDPEFIRAYLYSRVAADGEGKVVSDAIRSKEEMILARLDNESVHYQELMKIRAKEMTK